MKTKKLLSILLAILMLTGTLFANATAYEPEYEIISSVDIYNITRPVPGGKPETIGITVPEDANYYIDLSAWKTPKYSIDDFEGNFESGKIYALMLQLRTEKGYEFAKDLKVNVHGDAAEMISTYCAEFVYSPNTKCILHLCFHKLTDEGKGYEVPEVKLDFPDTIKANYGEIVDLNTITKSIPSGSNMNWEFSNSDLFENHSHYYSGPFGTRLDNNGTQFKIMPVKSGELTVSATMYYADYFNDSLICNNGVPVYDTKTVQIEVYPSITLMLDSTRNYGDTHIKYGETVRFSEDFHAAPEGSYLKWESVNGCVELDVSQDTRVCEVKKVRNADDVVKISLLDAEGNPLTDKDGKPVEHSIRVYTTTENPVDRFFNAISEYIYLIKVFFTNLFSFFG